MRIDRPVVVGGGAFGTALGSVIASTGMVVQLLVRDEGQRDDINLRHCNSQYLPDTRLPDSLRATTDIAEALHLSPCVFLAVPSSSLGSIAEQLRPHLRPGTCVLNLAKGLHLETLTLDRLLARALPSQVIGALKGPNFARPLLHGAPSGMTLALSDPSLCGEVQALFRRTAVHTETWDDLSAIEFVSAIKNVFAVVMGICDAIEDNPNTRFMILKMIVSESHSLLDFFGFDPKVLFTYAGLGDMLMTAMNDTSRNRTLGLLIGRGFDFIQQVSGPVTEGKKAARLLRQRTDAARERFPLISAVDAIFDGQLAPQLFHRNITRCA